MQNFIQGFQNINPAKNSQLLFEFLEFLEHTDSIRSCQQKMREILQVEAGHRILDIGCGVGFEVQRLAKIVGSHGLVVGLDHNEEMIKEARNNLNGSNLPIEYHVGDVNSLNFTDNSFDACRSERVFMYLKKPEEALAEMVRVVRPGGIVCIFDFYHDAFIIDSFNQNLARRIIHFLCDSYPNGLIGAKLPALFQDLGLEDINIIPHVITASYELYMQIVDKMLDKAVEVETISESELVQWRTEMEEKHKAGKFFQAITGFIISGKKI